MAKEAVNEPIATSNHGQPVHCKAAVIWAPGEKYKIEPVIVAAPRKHQVRIKILYASICNTDVTMANEKALAHGFPAIFGHEGAGIVESVGDGVTNVQAGDHVLPFAQGQCDECSYCKGNRTNMCNARQIISLSPTLRDDDMPRLTTEDGTILNVFVGLSTFSEYTVVHKDNVVKINREAPLEKVGLFSCGIATGMGAVWNIAKVQRGSTAAVFGLGTIGLAAVQACKLAGASRIIGVDINADKVNKGKELGMTDFINPKDHHDSPISKVIQELTGGGVEYSFECVGNVKLMRDAVESVLPGIGVAVILGYPSSTAKQEIELNARDLLFGKRIYGSLLGGVLLHDLPELVERHMSKEIQLDPFITHSRPLSKINEAMEIFASGKCLRCILQMGK